jgi:hypothetical protein
MWQDLKLKLLIGFHLFFFYYGWTLGWVQIPKLCCFLPPQVLATVMDNTSSPDSPQVCSMVYCGQWNVRGAVTCPTSSRNIESLYRAHEAFALPPESKSCMLGWGFCQPELLPGGSGWSALSNLMEWDVNLATSSCWGPACYCSIA